jgi:hypothetical protein
MTQLAELARLIRSKNAGPFQLTFDIMFSDEATYQRVKRAPTLTRASVASLYSIAEADTLFFHCDNAWAVKISIPRPYIQGDLMDADSHGGQQYAPLMDIEIP